MSVSEEGGKVEQERKGSFLTATSRKLARSHLFWPVLGICLAYQITPILLSFLSLFSLSLFSFQTSSFDLFIFLLPSVILFHPFYLFLI